jgi:hypothetical protein
LEDANEYWAFIGLKDAGKNWALVDANEYWILGENNFTFTGRSGNL